MKPTVYIETSIISYLTAKLSRDLIIIAHQQITSEWWEEALPKFDAYTSPIVIEEASRGDSHASKLRLEK
ncbi:MAG: DNA-binding protein, partial [Thermodesulfobacteriota bacterium]